MDKFSNPFDGPQKRELWDELRHPALWKAVGVSGVSCGVAEA